MSGVGPQNDERFAYTRETCEAIAVEARRDDCAWKPMLPVPAGGLAVERVAELRSVYGDDIMLLIGGSLLMAGYDLVARTRAFTQAAHAQPAAR